MSDDSRIYVDAGVPAIKMLVGDWYTDEVGVSTREIRARD